MKHRKMVQKISTFQEFLSTISQILDLKVSENGTESRISSSVNSPLQQVKFWNKFGKVQLWDIIHLINSFGTHPGCSLSWCRFDQGWECSMLQSCRSRFSLWPKCPARFARLEWRPLGLETVSPSPSRRSPSGVLFSSRSLRTHCLWCRSRRTFFAASPWRVVSAEPSNQLEGPGLQSCSC